MHVLNFLENDFKENTNRLLRGQLPGTLLNRFIEHRVFLFVLKNNICGNISTEWLQQSDIPELELLPPLPSHPWAVS